MKAGRIKVSEKLLLEWLQFPSATILEGKFNAGVRELELILKDEEMPEVTEGNPIEDVMPLYIRYQDDMGHWVATREPLNK